MGADYSIRCRYCRTTQGDGFYITRNYNKMFPFWMLHNHIEDCYDWDKRKPFVPIEEHKFLLKTVRNALRYYCKGNIYNHEYWSRKMKTRPEHHHGQPSRGWEVNKYTVIMALIRYYWHLKRYPFEKYVWGCWY